MNKKVNRFYELFWKCFDIISLQRKRCGGIFLSGSHIISSLFNSRRYTTDCQQAIFERRAELNYVGIDDLREYADDMANGEELIYQNSHMQVELFRCVA